MRMRIWMAVSLVVALGAEARAEVSCGSKKGRWNVPSGALVTSRAD